MLMQSQLIFFTLLSVVGQKSLHCLPVCPPRICSTPPPTHNTLIKSCLSSSRRLLFNTVKKPKHIIYYNKGSIIVQQYNPSSPTQGIRIQALGVRKTWSQISSLLFINTFILSNFCNPPKF